MNKYLIIIIIWFLRFFTLKMTLWKWLCDTAKGLFRIKSNHSMDAELWFEYYRDTLADKMPDSWYYHLPSCHTKKSVYTTNNNGIYKLLSNTQFLRMWREKFKKVVIPKVTSSSYIWTFGFVVFQYGKLKYLYTVLAIAIYIDPNNCT